MFDIIADTPVTLRRKWRRRWVWRSCRSMFRWTVSTTARKARRSPCAISTSHGGQPLCLPKTSLASIEDFEEVFRRQAEAGRPTLCLCFTGRMSGCVGSARNARELVLEDYPDAKIEVMDSAAATVTEATMVENAVAIRDAGCTLDEAVTWLEAEKSTNNIFFTVGNLDYLIKGGRIGKVSGRAANFLASSR